MASPRRSCAPRPEKSRSIASESGRGCGVSRCRTIASRNSRPMQERKITQPSKKCRKPSAWLMPKRSTRMPMMPIRTEFISTASGAAAASSVSLCQTGPR